MAVSTRYSPFTAMRTMVIAGALVVLAAAILSVPRDVPGFVVQGEPASLHTMKAMG